MIYRPRRLRSSKAMRALVSDVTVNPRNLILPIFVAEDAKSPREITSMPGVYQYDLDSLKAVAHHAAHAGLGGIDLFAIPRIRDAQGSQAWDDKGILNRALAAVRAEVGDEIVVIADTCLDEFTDHGHCGVLDDKGRVINDATNELYALMAISQAASGAHMVSPSGMMDHQVQVIREALDREGYDDVAIMAYSAKYASAFYGPFREAVDCQLTGDRRTYQMDPARQREGLLEAELDMAEGADIVMVKPASYYLDILSRIKERLDIPLAAYQVSGEYAMVEAAAQRGWIDRERIIMESLTSIFRAGADMVLTYWALEVAESTQGQKG